MTLDKIFPHSCERGQAEAVSSSIVSRTIWCVNEPCGQAVAREVSEIVSGREALAV